MEPTFLSQNTVPGKHVLLRAAKTTSQFIDTPLCLLIVIGVSTNQPSALLQAFCAVNCSRPSFKLVLLNVLEATHNFLFSNVSPNAEMNLVEHENYHV